MAEAEKQIIQGALVAAENNKSRAARHLGIHRTLLHRKMKLLGLD
jgi:two-component system, NtrC family, response regulator